MSYVGVPPFGQSTRTISEKIAAQDQVDFYPDGGYLPGYIDVIANGQELLTTDFTALDGVKVTLKNKRGANDEIRMIAYWPVSLVDTYRKSEADAKFVDVAGDTLTGPLNEAQGADIPSAASINLTAATGNYVNVTGTTAITSITLAQGAMRTVVFSGALTLTNGASLILPTGASITTAAGDVAMFRGEAGGVVRCVSYTKANGQSIASSVVPVDVQTFNSTGTWTKPTGGQTMARIQLWGGGGGGGRSATSGYMTGGGGGAYNEVTVPLSYINSQTVNVGAGGAGATATGNGAAGGTSSVTLATAWNGQTTWAAYGGGGGGAGSSLAGGGGGQTGAGGTATGVGGTPAVSSGNPGIYAGSQGAVLACGPWYFPTNVYHGGAGGANMGGSTPCNGHGSIWGGGGGGGVGAGYAAARSVYGGDGGVCQNPPTAGVAPAGGGAAASVANVNGAAGAAGRVIITCY